MPAKPLAKRATSPTRGRHLLATERLEKGQLIFCERPLVTMQSIGNVHSGALVCHYCLSFCGSPDQALCVAADPTELQRITTTACDCASKHDRPSDHALILCRHKCGQIYCSQECQQDDWEWGGHKELCTGCIEDIEHPLVQFAQHAVSSNEIFLLIAKWIARIHKQKIPYHDEENGSDLHPLVDFSMKLWWEVAILSMVDDPTMLPDLVYLKKSCRELCEESHKLLKAAWPHWKDSKWITANAIGRLVGSLEQNCIGVRRKHPIRQIVMEDSEFRITYHKRIIKCLEKAGMIGDGDEESSGDADGEVGEENVEEATDENDDQRKSSRVETQRTEAEEIDWDYSPDEIASFLAELENPLNVGSDDDWDAIFTPLDGTAHFAFTEKMNHSCEPSVVVLYKSRGWGKYHPLVAYCIALKDVEPGEELTIAYIETGGSYQERQQSLANYGFKCTCPKCERERNCDAKERDFDTRDELREQGGNDMDDLFGSEAEDEDSEECEVGDHGGEKESQGVGEPNGDSKLKNAAEQMETIWNKSTQATIPLRYLAPAASLVVQTASNVLQDPRGLKQEKDGVEVQLLQQCLNGAKERDFSLCRIVGPDLEDRLFRLLQTKGSFPGIEYREAYWCACCTASIGLAQEGSFLLALQNLDKAMIMGLQRRNLGDFVSYVESFASQMSATPCPHAISYTLDNLQNIVNGSELSSCGLSAPIRFTIKEISLNMAANYSFANASEPIAIRGLGKDWPATSKWTKLEELSHAHGHRLVPIEIGFMDRGMKEKVVHLREFLSLYLASSLEKACWSLDDATDPSSSIAYLAQHPLLDQIPELYEDVDRNPCGVEPTNVNAWIGTGGTRTPLHFDSYDNLLVQVVGAKYVRLYKPTETSRLYVSKDQGVALQGNMSQVNCEMEDFVKHPLAKEAQYSEVILMPGDSLYIPSGHWHYVRSLSTSISVNYWF